MNVVEMTRQLGTAIQASEEYKALVAARDTNDNDQALQDQIGEFNLKRMELNGLMTKEEKDEAAIAACNADLQAVYQAVMNNPNMIAFNEAKTGMDTMMAQVNTILSKTMNGEDPQTCPAEDAACGGSCSSCAGCH